MPDKGKIKDLTTMEIEDGVRGFSMAVREAVMDYYKGSCVQVLSSLSEYPVEFNRLRLPNDGTRRNFNYEREDWARRNPIAYYLAGSKMFELWRDDHEVIFQPSVMRRSPELSVAYDQITAFFQKFLPSVTIIERDDKRVSSHTDGSGDRARIFRDLDQQSRVNPPRPLDPVSMMMDHTYFASTVRSSIWT